MTYKVTIVSEKQILKDIRSIPKSDVSRIFDAIELLSTEPQPENLHIKKLIHYPTANYRLRVGSYRILLQLHESSKEIFILRIIHRSRLY
jgi:mRNA interferase RelE/StbE